MTSRMYEFTLEKVTKLTEKLRRFRKEDVTVGDVVGAAWDGVWLVVLAPIFFLTEGPVSLITTVFSFVQWFENCLMSILYSFMNIRIIRRGKEKI